MAERDCSVLEWVLARIRSSGSLPFEYETLAHVEAHRSMLLDLKHRGLVELWAGRVRPTRNGARAAVRGGASVELANARKLAHVLAEVGRKTGRSRLGLADVVHACGLTAPEAQLAALFVPGDVVDRETGLVSYWELPDLLALDEEVWSRESWEFVPPTSIMALLTRYRAGERRFESVSIAEAPAVDIGQAVVVDLHGVEIMGGELRVGLADGDLSDALFQRVALSGSALHRCSLRGVRLRSCEATALLLHECDLSGIQLEETTWSGVVERCRFTSSTPGLDRLLRCARWSTVFVDDAAVDPGWLDGPTLTSDAPAAGGGAERGAMLEVHTRGDDRIVRFRGREVLRTQKPTVGGRVLEVLTSHPGREIHVLDLGSMVDGHAVALESLTLDEAREVARILCPAIRLAPALPDVELRRSALLRRLMVLASEQERRRTRPSNAWTVEEEAEQCRVALAAPDHTPNWRATDDSPVARQCHRLSSALRRLTRALRRENHQISEFLDVAISKGELWRYVVPSAEEVDDSTR